MRIPISAIVGRRSARLAPAGLLVLALLLPCQACANDRAAESLHVATTTPTVVVKTGPPAVLGVELDTSTDALRNGLVADEQRCRAIPGTVWVAIDQHSACIRYFAAGLAAGIVAKRVMLYFPPDVWNGREPSAGYQTVTAQQLQQSAVDWAQRLGMPYVFMSRPGIYGSSGDHMQRRRRPESLLLSAAIDRLQHQFGFEEIVAVGYSGGGHVVAALLALRSDIVCAVPVAAPSSPALRARIKGWSVDSTGYDDSFEPVESLQRDRLHPALRVLVTGDPRDRNAVWPAQQILSQRLVALGVDASIVAITGTGPEFHFGQGDVGRWVGAWCSEGLAVAEIRERAASK